MCAKPWDCPIPEARLAREVPLLEPSAWVVRFLPLVSAGGKVLDLACGQGRHSALARESGFRVVAVDRDPVAMAHSAADEKIVIDLETAPWPFAGGSFDGIVVTNYLHRPLFPALQQALAPDGVLIYETFAAGQATVGRPARAAFLLAHGELLALTGGLHVVAYEEGVVMQPQTAFVQRICAVRVGTSNPVPRFRL